MIYNFKTTTGMKVPSSKYVNHSALPLNDSNPQYKRLHLMCGNTRPKLFEVSYGRTSQHDKGLLIMSSPRTHSESHGGFQTLDVEHRTDSRRPLDTMTETEENGDRQRQTKYQDTSPFMRPTDSRAHEWCSSFCSRRSSRGTALVPSSWTGFTR